MTHRMHQDAQAAGGRHWWTSAEQRSEQKQQAQSMDEVTRLNSKSPKIHWQDAPKVSFMFSNSEDTTTHQVFDGMYVLCSRVEQGHGRKKSEDQLKLRMAPSDLPQKGLSQLPGATTKTTTSRNSREKDCTWTTSH